MRRLSFVISVLLLAAACNKEPQYIAPVLPPDEKPVNPSVDPGSKSYDFSVVEQPLTASIVFTKGTMLRYYSVMQSFALCGNGYMYGIQVGTSTNKYLLNVTRKYVDSDSGKQYMQLPFAGHGGNMDLERSGNIDYLWVGSYGTWNGTKYTNSQTVARVAFNSGAKFTPGQCNEHFWVPGLRNVSPSLDIANDHLLIWGLANGESATGYFKVYSLSEAKKIPISDVKLERAITYGGEEGSGTSKVTETPTVKARNLSTLTPLANIRLNCGVLGDGSHQGVALFGDYILHLSGGGNDDNPSLPSSSALTVLDLKGNVLGHYNVGAISSKEDLASQGITDTGFMEAEGVKIYDDCLYLGYATKHSADDKRLVTIFKYDILKH